MNKSAEILVIFNPAAKGDRARALLDRILALSPRALVKKTKVAGDARALAERAVEAGYEYVVAAGGDGTVNEVVNGLAGSDCCLGLLPVGTMNVFATELGVPQDLEKAWAVIESGTVREIDLPQANGDYFVQLAGAGIDAEVVQRTTPDSKKALGPMSYFAGWDVGLGTTAGQSNSVVIGPGNT